VGYRLAGCHVAAALEFDPDMAAIYQRNLGKKILVQDIAGVSADDFLSFAGVPPGSVDILDGSPPCQGFSLSGQRQVTDARNGLFMEYVRLLRAIRPKVFIMENVMGMVVGKMRPIFRAIITALCDSEYSVGCRAVNAKWLGVPQARRRVIIVGVRSDLRKDPVFPKPERMPVSVRTALRGVKQNREETEYLLAQGRAGRAYRHYDKMRPGETAQKCIAAEKHMQTAQGFSAMRAAWDRPAPTIIKSAFMVRAGGLMHPAECRRFTTYETARLSSFPDDWIWPEFQHAIAGMGNSVPPLMMEAVARTVRAEVLAPISRDNQTTPD